MDLNERVNGTAQDFLQSMRRGEHDLPFRVEVWDDGDNQVRELVALCGDHPVARAAYEEAARRRPVKIVTLRQKVRLLADSKSRIR